MLWRPTAGKPYWSVSNIAEVWSRGLENRLHAETTFKNWAFQFEAGYDFIRSTNEVPVVLPKIEKGQQLIYVPENQGFTGLTLGYQNFELSYKHHFTGSVLTELGSLPAFQIGSFYFSHHRKILGMPSQIYLTIDNCWDADYKIIERRPMPGRSYQLGISATFTKT